MSKDIDTSGRRHLAALARRLAGGAITNDQFDDERPSSPEVALHDIYFYGLWPLYDDFVEHKLIGRWALSREGRTWVARIVLFLHSGLPYRYPRVTGISQIPVSVLSLVTLGWFGRVWRKRLWRGGDESVWPFFSRAEYNLTLEHPVFLNGSAQQGAQKGRAEDSARFS